MTGPDSSNWRSGPYNAAQQPRSNNSWGQKSGYQSGNRFGNNSSFGGNNGSYGNSGGNTGGNFSKFRDTQFAGGDLKPCDWTQKQLPPFQKNFYKEAASVANMTPSEVAAVRAKHEIQVMSPGGAPNPVTSFEAAGFPEELLKEFLRAGFASPSSIQQQGWPIALMGRDFVGIAETGSGKTLAFLAPAIVHIQAQPRIQRGDGPIALVLAPTRELVEQTREQANKFATPLGIRCTVAYGGVPRRDQLYALRNGAEICVACPGRLIDFLERGDTNLDRVTYFVVDEADRMLDMGWEPQIRKVLGQLRPDRQTLMYSATWPKEVQGLARDMCREDPVHITIGSTDLTANHNVTQHVEVIQSKDKDERLWEILSAETFSRTDGPKKTICFVATKRMAETLRRSVEHAGFRCMALHGDKSQEERTYTLNQLKSGQCNLVIATDVAARGLDIKDMKVVINYDMPNQVEDYVHRIGRTGRAGTTGVSYTFFTPDKNKLARELISIMKEANQKISPELQALTRGGYGGGGGNSYGGYRNNSYGGGRGGGYGGNSYGNSNNNSSRYHDVW